MPTTGKCYCGAIQFKLNEPTGRATHCHCEDCRKSHGTAFVTWTSVATEALEFIKGKDQLTKYESHPGVKWCFCSQCGTSLLNEHDAHPERIYMTVANLDGDLAEAPDGHVSYEEHVKWIEGSESLPKYREKTTSRMDKSKCAVIFTSRLKENAPGYEDAGQAMVELAATQKGFIGVDSVRGGDRNGITVCYWDSLDAIRNWKQNAQHAVAQKLGKEKWYESYSVVIAKVEREY